MVETYINNLEVNLGFLEQPNNSLNTTAPFLPSKVGGQPVIYSFLLLRLEWRNKNVNHVDIKCHFYFNSIAIWIFKNNMTLKELFLFLFVYQKNA